MSRAAHRRGVAATLLSAIAIGLAGCDAGAAGRQAAPSPRAQVRAQKAGGALPASTGVAGPAITDWTAGGCPFPSDNPPEPIGRSADELGRAYGRTAWDDRFILGEALDPVRMSVRNTLSSPADLAREVREQAWERAGCELRVWSVMRDGRWTAVATLRGGAGGEH